MTRKYNKIEINALQKLADFRNIFYQDLLIDEPGTKKSKVPTNKCNEDVVVFIEIFCQNNFADTDYSIMQHGPREFKTTDQWIDQVNIDTVLKCLTYIIWNNKIDEGYFLKKIEDGLVKKYLTRLQNILTEQKLQLKEQAVPVI